MIRRKKVQKARRGRPKPKNNLNRSKRREQSPNSESGFSGASVASCWKLWLCIFSPIIFFIFFYLHLPSFAFSSLHLPSLVKVPEGGLEGFFAVPPARLGPAGAGCELPERKLTAPTFLMLEDLTIVSNFCQGRIERNAEFRMQNADGSPSEDPAKEGELPHFAVSALSVISWSRPSAVRGIPRTGS